MGVVHEYRHAIAAIELADAIGLLLREQQPAIIGPDDAVGVVGALPRARPRRSRSDHARDLGDRNLAHTSRRTAPTLRRDDSAQRTDEGEYVGATVRWPCTRQPDAIHDVQSTMVCATRSSKS